LSSRFATLDARWRMAMAKKKRNRKERYEQALGKGEDMPSVRRLRELYERGMAELEARGEPRPQGVDSVQHLRELYARGMAELEAKREAEAEPKG
jgi:hypothetical protein